MYKSKICSIKTVYIYVPVKEEPMNFLHKLLKKGGGGFPSPLMARNSPKFALF